jgi:tetratricopeptide (TPR) repeat protein
MGGFLVLAGLAFALVGFVSIIKPLSFLKITTRAQGLVVLVLGVVLMGAGGSMLETTSPQRRSSQRPQHVPSPKPTLSAEARYKAARAAIDAKNWAQARARLAALPANYRDVATLRIQVRNAESRYWYDEAMKAKAKGNYSLAYQLLKQAKEAGGKLPSTADGELTRLRSLAARQEAREAERAAAEQERAAARARQEETNTILRQMAYYTNGAVGIAVGEVRLRRSLGDYFATGNGTYVLVLIGVKNFSLASEHVNPNNFTLSTPDGYTVPHNIGTYSLNYLDAVDLRQGQTTSGWIAFLLPKASKYTLNYQSFNVNASKEIAPGKAIR